jgi:hypothetical protein
LRREDREKIEKRVLFMLRREVKFTFVSFACHSTARRRRKEDDYHCSFFFSRSPSSLSSSVLSGVCSSVYVCRILKKNKKKRRPLKNKTHTNPLNNQTASHLSSS